MRRKHIRTNAEPSGEVLRELRRLFEWDDSFEGWCVRNRYTGMPVRDWTIRLRGYELRTLDVARYLQYFTWPWERDPDYGDHPPPEIFR